MYCGNCGVKLPDHSKSCTRCGQAVEEEEFDPWKQTPPPRQPGGIYAKPKKKKRRLLPLLVLILLAVLAVLVIKKGPGIAVSPSNRLPSVPKELKEHAFLQSRDQGPCGILQGDVGITVIFVNDADSIWSQSEIDAYMSAVHTDVQGMTQDAAIWGRELSVVLDTKQSYISDTVTSDHTDIYLDAILRGAGLPEEDFHDHLEDTLGVDQAPVVFVLNKAGRASAQMGTKEEFCFLFEDVSAFRHELYHLFGAEDLYYPAEVTAIAEQCFTESIMLGYECDKVDDLTAYLIGWSNSLSQEALSFLNQTTWVTDESMREAYQEEALTGYGTKEYDDGTYTGDLNMGVPHGWGSLTMHNGDSFDGQFENGIRSGTGTYRWSNGDEYQGAFVNDVRTGYGTFTWSNGDKYEGAFENDVRTGFGIYTWSDGTRYEGDFLNAEMTGTGTFYWTDGSKYYGDFLNGALHGYGTLTYPDGETVSGTWHNSEYLG